MGKSEKSLIAVFSLLALLLTIVSGTAWAGAASEPRDVLKVKINESLPAAIVSLTEGGSPLSQGILSASETIVVRYNLVATSFPSTLTPFGTFNLGLAIEAGTGGGGGPTTYPLTVNLSQAGGGEGLVLTPDPTSFLRGGRGEFGPSNIAMSINCPACTNTDGEEISRNLQFSSTVQNLVTTVKVQVIIKLVHPTSCLNLYHFLTDQDLTTRVNSTEVVVVKSGKNAGRVNATTPFGQFSDNVLLANICQSAEQFDLKIILDPSFDTNPSNNPGNAVFTYFAGEVVDPTEAFNVNAFSSRTPQGQTLCLMNVSLPGGESFLATVHMGIQRGIHQSSLDADGDFNFSAKLYPYGSGCTTGEATYSAEATMTYTIK